MRTGPTLEVENIMGYDPVECKARAKRDLEAGNLFPRQLSGDMQQRASIARAVARSRCPVTE